MPGRQERPKRQCIRREKTDEGFAYTQGGKRITSRREIERIEALVIPPAWIEVEIAPSPQAKVLARGVDAAGRVQRLYRPGFRQKQELLKYERVVRFGMALPKLRRRVERDLRRRRMGRDKAMACVVRLIDLELLRVGSVQYAKQNNSFGITTLRRKHLRVGATQFSMEFVGKSGKLQQYTVRDRQLTKLIRELSEMPGHEIFRYLDEQDRASLPQIFNTSASNTSWIITITLLASAIAMPVYGRLADMYGKKQIMLVAIVPFIIGSIVCAVSVEVGPMIFGRALQGLASGVIPLGIALMHDVLPKEKTSSAIALMSSSMGIGGALGLPIAAAVAELASWRVLFWATAVIAVIVTAGIVFLVPKTPAQEGKKKFDFIGAIGLAIGLVGLLLGISKGAEWGWGSPATLGCLGVAVIVLLLWGWYETRIASPLVDLRTTARPTVLLTNLASILIGFTMYAMNLIAPQIMQLPLETGYGLGQSMLQMGLWAAPMGIGMMAVSGLGGKISRGRGPKVTLTLAGIVIAVGYGVTSLVFATIGNRSPGAADDGTVILTLVLMSFGLLISGCGIGFAYGSMPALIMGSVPATQKAGANGFNSLMRSLGTTVSAALVGAVLAAMTTQFGDFVLPSQGGLLVSLVIGFGIAAVATLLSAAIPVRKQR